MEKILTDQAAAQFAITLSLARVMVDSGAISSDVMEAHLQQDLNSLPEVVRNGLAGEYYKQLISAFKDKKAPVMIVIAGGKPSQEPHE